MTIKAPNPPYLGPVAHISVGNNLPIWRVVIHSTVTPCVSGGVNTVARIFKSEASGGSAHYGVDPDGAAQYVWDREIAWGAPAGDTGNMPDNTHEIHIEMCDIPGPVPGDKPGSALWKAARRVWRWNRPEQQSMLLHTAHITARICAAYDVPIQFLGVSDLLAHKHGITTHANISKAWKLTTHWDPGFWPRRKFMRLVQQHYTWLVAQDAHNQ